MKVIIHLNKDDVPDAATVVQSAWATTSFSGEEVEVQLKGVNKHIKEAVWYAASRLHDGSTEWGQEDYTQKIDCPYNKDCKCRTAVCKSSNLREYLASQEGTKDYND